VKSGTIDAIITARGGSKGLPRKNLLPLAGQPLIAHSIRAALGCSLVRRCWVTTEDPEIKAESLRYGAEVIERPLALATDASTSGEAVRHALETLAARGMLAEHFALLQPTSPLRTAAHLSACLEAYLRSEAHCAISVCVTEHHPYKSFREDSGWLEPLFDEALLHAPRQSLSVVYRQNGAIYAIPSRLFLERHTFYVRPAMPFVMSQEDSADIDTLDDLERAERLLARRGPAAAG
jgi:CMP-N,N'-diacetyllegionaminic acid synthase